MSDQQLAQSFTQCNDTPRSVKDQGRLHSLDFNVIQGQISPSSSPDSPTIKHPDDVIMRIQKLHTTPLSMVQYSKASKIK